MFDEESLKGLHMPSQGGASLCLGLPYVYPFQGIFAKGGRQTVVQHFQDVFPAFFGKEFEVDSPGCESDNRRIARGCESGRRGIYASRHQPGEM
jgi:hypothetical protein